jgi:hypothetical protein
MSLDADQIFAKIQTAGEDWADRKAAFCALDDLTETVKADLTTDFYTSCSSKAEAAERAKAASRFKEHLASVAGARRAWLFAEVKYTNLKLLADLRRSEESTRRAEMGLR